MSRLFLTGIDLGGNQLIGAVIEVLASAPSHAEGRIYYDSTLDALRVSDGSAWTTLGASGSGAPSDGDKGDIVVSSTGTVWMFDSSVVTAAAKTVLDDTTTGAMLTTLGAVPASSLAATVQAYRLDQFAVPTADLSINSHKLTNVTDPSSAQDAATKNYVDGIAQGLSAKDSVRVATTANGTLATAYENGDTVDGVTLATGDRILLKDQTTGAENGIYTVNASGAPTRAVDFDSNAEIAKGAFVFVEEGTDNADSGWVLTTDGAITIDTTSLAFTQFSGAGQITAGTGLTKSANTLAIDTASGYGVRKVAANVGDGSSTSITITHSLGSRDVSVQVYQAATPWAQVFPDIEANTTSAVILRFATAPTTNQYRVVVVG